MLEYLCDLIDINYSDFPRNARAYKNNVYLRLIAKINEEDSIKCRQLLLYNPAKPLGRVVLGKDVMEAIWADMRRTQLPTWIRPAPPNWGTAQRGKLSADQYHVICMIHVVVTLVRLWANETSHKKEMLKHFMDLVSTVHLANLCVISQDKIDTYNEYIFRYAAKWTELLPNKSLKLILHAALHIGNVMELFGPEWTRACNLRALLSEDTDLRAAVSNMIQAIEATEEEDARGFRLTGLLDPTSHDSMIHSNACPIELSNDNQQQLRAILVSSHEDNHEIRLQRHALAVIKISSCSITYGTSTSAESKNSNILFQPGKVDQESIAGVIDRIFQHTHEVVGEDGPSTHYYLTVHPLLPVDPKSDLYCEFGFAGGFLCASVPGPSRLIKLSQVVSHVAVTLMGDGEYSGLMHVLPVDWLMLSFHLNEASAVGD
ncbi:hypothetical protein DXG01_015220 [Tephrocybe rancida]|nr:hypothetical protein DXG01_015220 [Tephrocybe rancida]